MSTQLRWIAAAVAALAMGQVSAQTYANPDYARGNGYGYRQTRTVRCESIGSRRAFCRVNTQGSVRILRQISHNACIQGRSWSYGARGIWVSNGCRADFAIGSRRYDRRGDTYGANGYNPDGYGANYNSDSGYRNDSNYRNGNDDSRDSNGNSAYGHTHYVDNSGRIIHCQSSGDGRSYCGDSHTRYTMSGNRDPDCIEGQTWGTDGRGTWVSGGCNADFSSDEHSSDDSGYQHEH